jgi:pimeloyl-ACP methyl ester carboxylesterase
MFASGPRDASREAIIERDVAIRRRIGSRGHRITEAELQRRAARAYDRAFRPGGTLRQTHAIVATGSLEGLLHSVRAPTQIIHGSEDVFVRPVGGRRSAKLIRNARLTVIEGMGHDLPDPLLPRIAELIAGNIARA